MPSTAPYAPTFDFPSDPAPQNLVNAQALQTQLQLISANLADLIQALGVSVRDDDTLTDSLVRIRNLHPELALYIQGAISGDILTQNVTYFYPVEGASIGNFIALSGPVGVFGDTGIVWVTGMRILVKDQTNQTQNGIWIVNTAGAWTRATDLPDYAPISSNLGVIIREGNTYAQTAWQMLPGVGAPETSPVVTTDEQEWIQIYGPFPIPVSKGGTGATNAVQARTNLGVPGKFVGTIVGTGLQTVFTVTHNLNTQDVICSVRFASGEQIQIVDPVAVNVNQLTFSFVTPPLLGETLTVTVIG